MFIKVAVSAATFAIDKPYDYSVPEELEKKALPGMRVFVPFGRGNRVSEGIVLSCSDRSDFEECKGILRFADEEPLLSEELLKLAVFMRERYFCTVYDAVRAMLPAGYWFDRSGRQKTHDKTLEMVRLAIPAEEAQQYAETKRRSAPRQAEILDLLSSFEVLAVQDLLRFTHSDRKVLNRLAELEIVELYQREVLRRPEPGNCVPKHLPDLSEEQKSAMDYLVNRISQDQSGVSLLSGVTGSGKTQIYAHLIDMVLRSQCGVILLVPEISLTPQMLSLFSSWFGDAVAILHSGLSAGERYDEWKRIRRGDAHLVIGTRSAVFAPVEKLALVIVDEEQEDSYISESNPRYHAKEVARFRCFQNQASLVLGSATPDIRSRYHADTGKYHFFRLKSRFNARPLPEVHIVDMKQELMSGNTSNLSSALQEAILKRIDQGEQSILFLNRRGTSKLVTCTSCGYIYRCPHCSVSMTWHGNRRRMICHYCGTSRSLDAHCPDCGGTLSFFGAGTQMLEAELREIFPGHEVLRVDADTVSPVGSHRVLFERFVEEKIPLMIGTQMVAKGLNFENVTLVGVISADQSLYSNDFRAGEKTFALLTQVIGRAGRSNKSGEAFIQTFTPENEIIRLAAAQDYEAFYQRELEMRRLQNAPPFYDWVSLSASGKDEQQLLRALHVCKEKLSKVLPHESVIQILGPVPMAVVKINDRFRYRIQICCSMNRAVRLALSSILVSCSQDKEMRNIFFYIENEPEP